MASLTDNIANFFSGNDSATDEGLRDLFISELKGIYYTEKQEIKLLGEQANASTSDEVKAAFLHHRDESITQLERLVEIFRIIGMKTEERQSDAINGLIGDARWVISDTESGSLTRDAGLIIAAQTIEHYEIAIYGSLLTLAEILDFGQSAELLALTLEEEKQADRNLTDLAKSFVNKGAKEEEDRHPGSHHASRRPPNYNSNATMGGSLGI